VKLPPTVPVVVLHWPTMNMPLEEMSRTLLMLVMPVVRGALVQVLVVALYRDAALLTVPAANKPFSVHTFADGLVPGSVEVVRVVALRTYLPAPPKTVVPSSVTAEAVGVNRRRTGGDCRDY
jgi:hypothetical protein